MMPPSTFMRGCHRPNSFTAIGRQSKIFVSLLVILSSLLAFGDAFQPFLVATRKHYEHRKEPLVCLNGEAEKVGPENPALNENIDYNGRISPPDEDYRCGFVSLIGAANMGKSTLLNALLDESLVTATARPQTTRHSILGVHTSDIQKCQLCYLDSPGVIDEPAYKLQEGMMEAVKGAFQASDAVLVITDLFSTPIPDDDLFRKLNLSDRKKIVVINKIDLAEQVNLDSDQQEQFHRIGNSDEEEEKEQYKRTVSIEDAVLNWRQLVPDALAIIPMSASNGPKDAGVVALRTLLVGGPDVPKAFRDLGRPLAGMFMPGVKFINDETASEIIPSGPPLYDSDTLTDRTERFFASEIIRATLFTKLGKELPYCCEVIIEQFREPRPDDKRQIIRIQATICVERESQISIVVGKGGAKIKEVGVDAREKLEDFLQEKVHLGLNVKLEKNWRRDEKKLKAYGYLK